MPVCIICSALAEFRPGALTCSRGGGVPGLGSPGSFTGLEGKSLYFGFNSVASSMAHVTSPPRRLEVVQLIFSLTIAIRSRVVVSTLALQRETALLRKEHREGTLMPSRGGLTQSRHMPFGSSLPDLDPGKAPKPPGSCGKETLRESVLFIQCWSG